MPNDEDDMQDGRYQRITLRIPKRLHAQLMREANKASRSMNAEIIARLESARRYSDVLETYPKGKKISELELDDLRNAALVLNSQMASMFDLSESLRDALNRFNESSTKV